MKQIYQGLILCLSFLGFACSGDVMHKPLPDEKQLDEAIVNTLKLGSFTAVFKSDTATIPFSTRIVPYVFRPEKVFKTRQPAGSFGSIYLDTFYDSENNEGPDKSKLFSADDTIYFKRQIESFKERNVDETLFTTIKLAGYDSIQKLGLPFYKVNQPLFSADQQRIFVEIDHYYYGGGWGQGIVLTKDKGQWVLTKRWKIWGI
jgi:hypothetical protein